MGLIYWNHLEMPYLGNKALGKNPVNSPKTVQDMNIWVAKYLFSIDNPT